RIKSGSMQAAIFLGGLLCGKSFSRDQRKFEKQSPLALHQGRPVGGSLFQMAKQILTVWRRNHIELSVANGNDEIVPALRLAHARQIVEMSAEKSYPQVVLAHRL